MPRSLVVYRGPSRYNGAPIRAVLTRGSGNVKTGNMAQLFILPDDVAPHTAQQTGADAAVCGKCPLRPELGGGCYVVTCQGPLSTWKATNGQPVAGAGEIAGLLRRAGAARLGAYGDPAALPPYVVRQIFHGVKGRVTGYTHGHLVLGPLGVDHLRSICMMSVETSSDAQAAHDAGWRTFRVTSPEAPQLPREIECPSPKVLCADCLLCRGSSLPSARSITIPAHGTFTKRALAVVQ